MNACRRAVPWLILMILSATGARFMQIGVESTADRIHESGTTTASNRFAGNLADPWRRVMLVVSFVDPSGSREQVRCVSTDDRVPTDSLFLDVDDVQAVVAELCEWTENGP